MPTRVFITGGTGLIGSHLTNALLPLGYQVTVYSRTPVSGTISDINANLQIVTADISDVDLLSRSLLEHSIVFHKASSQATSKLDEVHSFHENVSTTQNLISAIREQQGAVKRVIFDSSISVYGEGCYRCEKCGTVRPPVRTEAEIQMTKSFDLLCVVCGKQLAPAETSEDEALNGSSPYARSKITQERLLADASKELGFSLTILRYATVYGPGQRSKNPYARFLNAMLKGGTITIHEDGLQRRDFLYAEDAVRSNLLAMSSQTAASVPQIFNIGTGTEISLNEFVRVAEEQFWVQGHPPKHRLVYSGAMLEGDIRHCKINVSRAKENLGFAAARDLKSGLSKYIALLISHHDFSLSPS